MDIGKVRGLSDQELGHGAGVGTPTSVRPSVPAGHPSAVRLQPDRADATHHRPTADRPDRARVSAVGRRGRRASVRGGKSMSAAQARTAREAQDQGRPRRLRQDGQDHRRLGRAPRAAQAVQARHPADDTFKAHDERNEARIGDTVRIEESRPLSATKRWRLVEIVKRAADGSTDCRRGVRAGDRGGHPRGGASRS